MGREINNNHLWQTVLFSLIQHSGGIYHVPNPTTASKYTRLRNLICKAYLCSKSLPVAYLDYKNIDELIALIGLDAYYSLIERDWEKDLIVQNVGLKLIKMKS